MKLKWNGFWVWLMAWGTGLVAAHTWSAEGTAPPIPQSITVSNVVEGQPFGYRQHPPVRHSQWTLYRLEFSSPVVSDLPQNNIVPADFYVPADWKEGQPGRPAVICLPILNGDEDLTAMMCTVLAGRGIAAVTFKLPYYGVRGPAEGRRALAANPRTFLNALEQAGREIRRLVDLLQSRPEVDPSKVGIAGISLGGIMSATAAGMDARLQRAVLMLAGGDLTAMIHHARETRPLSQMIRGLPAPERVQLEEQLRQFDPLTHAPQLRERARQGRVLMLNAEQDEVIPRACTEKLAEALGISEKVVWFEGLGHYTALAELPRAMRMMADFFASDLPPERQRSLSPTAASTNGFHRLAAVLHQVATMAGTPPATGRCHYAEGDLFGVDPHGRSLSGTGRMVIGSGSQFAFFMAAPGLGEWMAGQGEFPWLKVSSSGQGLVLVGTEGGAGAPDWNQLLDAQHRLKLGLLHGLTASLAMAPDLLQRWVSAEWDKEGWLCITPKETRYGDASLRIKFQTDGVTPAEIQAEAMGYDITFTVRGWQTNTLASSALFAPPLDVPRKPMERASLARDMAGVLNYLGDQVKIGPPAAGATNAHPLPRMAPADFLQRYRNWQ